MADDWESFDAWVRSREHRLVRAAYLLTGDIHHAEDLVQDALVKLAQRWARLQDQNAEGYVRRVIYHDYVSWWRRKRPRLAETLPDTEDADHSELVARRQVVMQALATLTVKQRAVIVLRYFEDLSEQQTADLLGVRVGTVKSQTSAAIARLRTLGPEFSLAPQEGGSER
ncbi:MAG TPA: SigE family RNA polymerase sigma factor [Actinomycetes bacterium]|nr:SigE family RNA polymerase sigma factor [Actinomycetes bacterium]